MVLIRIRIQCGNNRGNTSCKKVPPEPLPRNSNTCRNAHFPVAEMSIPASVRVSWKGFGGTFFTQRRFSPIFRRTEDWHAVEKFWKHPELCC